MASCNNCHKGPPEISNLKKCAKCMVTQYCSRDCQKDDWKAHRSVCGRQDSNASSNAPAKGLDSPNPEPLRRLKNGTWLHDRPEVDVYRLLIDAYRLNVEDSYTMEGEIEIGSIRAGNPDGLRGFRDYLDLAEEHHSLLPSWWSDEKRAACERLGMDASQWSNLRHGVERNDIVEHYGDDKMPMQLGMLTEHVLGEVPSGGMNGSFLREMALRAEEDGFEVEVQSWPPRPPKWA